MHKISYILKREFNLRNKIIIVMKYIFNWSVFQINIYLLWIKYESFFFCIKNKKIHWALLKIMSTTPNIARHEPKIYFLVTASPLIFPMSNPKRGVVESIA